MIAKSIVDVAKSLKNKKPAQSVYQGKSYGTTTSIIKRWMSMMNFRKCAESLN